MNAITLIVGICIAALGHYLEWPVLPTAIAALGVPAAILFVLPKFS